MKLDLNEAELAALAGLLDQGVRAVGLKALDEPAVATLWAKIKAAASQPEHE